MGKVPTSLLDHDHAYTRSESPWIIAERDVAVGTPYERLIKYISGGGMRMFGRTVRQEEVRLKRLRFISAAAVIAALWLVFFIF
ncbi:MAG: hypothetical protein J6T01_02625 [Kiritimatiellae bacterium]|nr:hypothetical protein [Kiritimatiellia bacterium]